MQICNAIRTAFGSRQKLWVEGISETLVLAEDYKNKYNPFYPQSDEMVELLN